MTTNEISSERLDGLIADYQKIIDAGRSSAPDRDALAAFRELRDRRAAGGQAVAWRWRSTKGGWGGMWHHTGNPCEVEHKLSSHYDIEPLYLHPSHSGMAAPEGWVLVPKAPTDEMLQAFEDEYVGLFGAAPGSPWSKGEKLFIVMVDAAPSPDAGKSQDEEGTWSDGGKEWTPAHVSKSSENEHVEVDVYRELVITDTMVERASRAICLAQGYKEGELDDIGRISHLPLWQDKLGAARAALVAALKGGPDVV